MYKFQEGIHSFFGNFVYDRVIPQEHFLRKVAATIDFSFINALCQDLYHRTGAGQKPYAPSFLFKVLFLGFTHNVSDRDIEEQINDRISFKWFLDLGVDEQAPDHSTLTVFRERLGEARFRDIFNRIVGLAKEKGLTDERLKMIDATHILADANRSKAEDKSDETQKPFTKCSSDPDARVGYKSKTKPFYGYKSHERIDTKIGIVEDLVVTPGNVSDVTCFPELVEDLSRGCAVTADQIYETDAHEYLCIRKKLRPYLAVKTNRKDPHRQGRRKDPAYQAALYLRKLYERTFGEAKEHHGMRRCRWRGRWKTELQCLLTATVQNIKRIVKYAEGPPPLHPLYAQYFS